MTLRVVFFGTPPFAACGLTALLNSPAFAIGAVVTQPDRPAGRGAKVQASPVKTVALAAGIPILQPERIKRTLPIFLSELAAHGAFDVGIVIAFGQILPPEVLAVPRAGCVNVHASLLPRWRGAAPIHRALLAGDSATGVCLMRMEAGLDTGPVYSRAETPIAATDTLASLHDRLADLGAALLLRDVPAIVSGALPPVAQPEVGVTYAAKIDEREARLDWRRPASELDRQVRALFPAPGAYTTCGGKRLKIAAAHPDEDSTTPAEHPPGKVQVTADAFVVQCGTGRLVVTMVQPEGKKRMAAADFARGLRAGAAVHFDVPDELSV